MIYFDYWLPKSIIIITGKAKKNNNVHLQVTFKNMHISSAMFMADCQLNLHKRGLQMFHTFWIDE